MFVDINTKKTPQLVSWSFLAFVAGAFVFMGYHLAVALWF